jgi:accessory gene regulator B
MKRVCDRLAGAIMRRGGREDAGLEVVSYGLQCALVTIFEFVSIIILAALLGMLKEILVILAVFVTIRHAAGGVHFSTFTRCLVSSVIYIISGGFTARFISGLPAVWGMLYLAVGGAFAVYAALRHAPRENPNRPISEKEQRRFRRVSRVIIGIVLIGLLLDLLYRGYALWYHHSLVTGLLLEGFALTDAGHRMVKFTEDKLDKGGGVANEES